MYRNGHFHPSDPFDLFRNFFGNHDPFNDPFLDPFLDPMEKWNFSHHSAPHQKPPRDMFQSNHSNLHVSIFDDLPAGTSTCSTTFRTGEGGTVHITRTLVTGDGSVRREMRFRTPSSSRAGAGAGQCEGGARVRGGRAECEGRGAGGRAQRQPSREPRGHPDGAAGGCS